MPTLSSSFFFLLLISATHSRKLLQDPFFPSTQSPPPAKPPAVPFTKYPFSSETPPFFPQLPAPPPPFSAPNQPTFPANISSLVFPNSQSSARRRSSSAKLASAILLPLLAFSILSLSLAFYLRRRSSGSTLSCPPEKTTFFPPNHSFSDDDDGGGGETASSPELRPLPPLTRQVHHNNADVRCSSTSEEFYSPRNSSLGRGSSSQKEFATAAMETCGSGNETLSTTPSYPSSGSESRSPRALSPPLGWSPEKSTAKSTSLRSSRGDFKAMSSPAMSSPSIPEHFNPPAGKTLSPTDPLSDLKSSEVIVPLQKRKSSSFENLQLLERNGEVEDKLMQTTPPPPPPPPPPPRAGYWESKIRRSHLNSPPSLVSPNPVDSTKFVATNTHLENQEKNEEIPRPKLKPLHWDKVRASSDRAMVWDQLKSSSFQ